MTKGTLANFALDAAFTNRVIDQQSGYLCVKDNVLTSATVSPYLGKEILGWENLGLQPNELYSVYRPAEELAKAVTTFKGVPIFDDHPEEPITAQNIKKYKEQMIGAVGDDIHMLADDMRGGLKFYDGEAIEKILSDDKRRLSCGYWYDAVMESGLYKGTPYDIRMQDINCNHIALVEKGRVAKAMVNDSAMSAENGGTDMADMTVTVSDPAPEAAAPVIDNAPPPAAEVVDNSPAVAVEAQDETGGSREEQIRILREKLAALEAEGSAVMDEQIPAKDESPDEEDKEKSAAADSADRIRSKVYNEVIKQFRERDIALDEVRPIIGMGVRTSAMDSAESVYRYALTRKGVAAPEGINLAGLKGMVAAILATSGVVRTAAQDAAPAHVEDDGIAALLSGVRTV